MLGRYYIPNHVKDIYENMLRNVIVEDINAEVYLVTNRLPIDLFKHSWEKDAIIVFLDGHVSHFISYDEIVNRSIYLKKLVGDQSYNIFLEQLLLVQWEYYKIYNDKESTVCDINNARRKLDHYIQLNSFVGW